MALYEDPRDQRIYDIEQINERARYDFAAAIAEEKKRKNKRASFINGAILTALFVILLYSMWMFYVSISQN